MLKSIRKWYGNNLSKLFLASVNIIQVNAWALNTATDGGYSMCSEVLTGSVPDWWCFSLEWLPQNFDIEMSVHSSMLSDSSERLPWLSLWDVTWLCIYYYLHVFSFSVAFNWEWLLSEPETMGIGSVYTVIFLLILLSFDNKSNNENSILRICIYCWKQVNNFTS